jgi:hypothetical protein
MTAVANSAFTAAQFNTHVRDNLLETAAAKATQSGSFFVGTGTNSLAERVPQIDFLNVSETTASTSFTDLATPGPVVTVVTGVRALVIVSAFIANNTGGSACAMGCAISGASTEAAGLSNALRYESGAANDFIEASYATIYSTLTPGTNTFTAKYSVTGGTGTFNARRVVVIPF